MSSGIILTDEQEWVRQQLLTDYEFFSRTVQRIEPKDLEIDEDLRMAIDAIDGEAVTLQGTIPFIFHPGQQRLHLAVEDQKQRTGRVSKALVKPRQVGWSTYIQGRGQWLCTKTPGMKVFIVSHNGPSTKKFLRRVKKMCLSVPQTLALGRQVDNSTELTFSNNASYAIATAGNPDSLRSDNAHFLHASEEDYWEDGEATTAAIIPAMSKGIGSERFRETTSNGRGRPWHNFINETLAGENEWEVFFDPWYLHPKYRLTPPPGWTPNDEALEAQRMFRLDMHQVYWRAMMIKDLKRLWLFKQEFPATIDESFQSRLDSLVKPEAVMCARKNTITPDEYAPVIMGVDPARTGDRTCITFRQGNVWLETFKWPKMDAMQLVGICANFLSKGYKGKKIAKLFIDHALGESVASRLWELHYTQEVMVVHFGESPTDPRFLNKRAEMAVTAGEWFGDTGEHVSIPDEDDIASDVLCIPDFVQSSGSEKIKLVPKEQIKKDFGKSPDIFDSFMLTFAFPVRAERVAELQQFAKQNLAHLPPTELGAIMRDFDAA